MGNTLESSIKSKGYTLVELLLVIGIASSMAVMVFLFGARLYESSKVAAAREIAIRVAGGVEGRYAASLSFAGIGAASPSYVQGIVLQGGAIAAPWGPATLSASTISSASDAWTLTFSGVPKSACAELLAQVSPNFGASGANSGWSAAPSGKGVDPVEAISLCSGSPNTVSFRSKARSGSGAATAVAAALACPSGQAAVAGACVAPPSPSCAAPWALNAAGTACELSCPGSDMAAGQGGTGCATLCVYPQALSSDGIHCQGPSTALACALPLVANASGTACVISCPSPTVSNAAGSACVIPLACSAPFVANASGSACECVPPKVPSADGLSCVAAGTDCPSAGSLQSWTGSDASSCKGTPVAVSGSVGASRSAASAAGVSGATGIGTLAQTCAPIAGAPGTFQWVNGSSTCALPPPSCPAAPSPNPVVANLGCPSGYSGSNTSSVAKTCGAGTGYAWVAGSPVLSNTCAASSAPSCPVAPDANACTANCYNWWYPTCGTSALYGSAAAACAGLVGAFNAGVCGGSLSGITGSLSGTTSCVFSGTNYGYAWGGTTQMGKGAPRSPDPVANTCAAPSCPASPSPNPVVNNLACPSGTSGSKTYNVPYACSAGTGYAWVVGAPFISNACVANCYNWWYPTCGTSAMYGSAAAACAGLVSAFNAGVCGGGLSVTGSLSGTNSCVFSGTNSGAAWGGTTQMGQGAIRTCAAASCPAAPSPNPVVNNLACPSGTSGSKTYNVPYACSAGTGYLWVPSDPFISNACVANCYNWTYSTCGTSAVYGSAAAACAGLVSAFNAGVCGGSLSGITGSLSGTTSCVVSGTNYGSAWGGTVQMGQGAIRTCATSCPAAPSPNPVVTNLGCPSGYTGSKTSSVTQTCGAGTGYVWGPSAPVVSNTCVPSCPAAPSPNPVVTNLGCPSGYTGSNTSSVTKICDASTGYAWVVAGVNQYQYSLGGGGYTTPEAVCGSANMALTQAAAYAAWGWSSNTGWNYSAGTNSCYMLNPSYPYSFGWTVYGRGVVTALSNTCMAPASFAPSSLWCGRTNVCGSDPAVQALIECQTRLPISSIVSVRDDGYDGTRKVFACRNATPTTLLSLLVYLSFTCPANSTATNNFVPSCVCNSGYSLSGSSCVSNLCPAAPSPNPVVTNLGCPSGYTGSNTSSVTKTCGSGTGYAWVPSAPVVSNTCSPTTCTAGASFSGGATQWYKYNGTLVSDPMVAADDMCKVVWSYTQHVISLEYKTATSYWILCSATTATGAYPYHFLTLGGTTLGCPVNSTGTTSCTCNCGYSQSGSSCVLNLCPAAPSPNPVVTNLGCPSGYSGSNTSSVTQTCGAGTGYAWAPNSPVISNTCVAPASFAPSVTYSLSVYRVNDVVASSVAQACSMLEPLCNGSTNTSSSLVTYSLASTTATTCTVKGVWKSNGSVQGTWVLTPLAAYSCPANSTGTTSCICNSGYSLSGSSCV